MQVLNPSDLGTDSSSSICIPDLGQDILIAIFSYLDICQIAIVRRVCKDWSVVIDSNQILWRIFDWDQRITARDGSLTLALDLANSKSRSTIETVSVRLEEFFSNFPGKSERDNVYRILSQCTKSLRHVSLTFAYGDRDDHLVELIPSSPNLRSLVQVSELSGFRPAVQPIPSSHNVTANTRGSAASKLMVLWLLCGSETLLTLDSKLFESLISFTFRPLWRYAECRIVIAKFSWTIVHLALRLDGDETEDSVPLSCPNLRFFEGELRGRTLSSFLDAPGLQFVNFHHPACRLDGLPVSFRELWINFDWSCLTLEGWTGLNSNCPNLHILRLLDDDWGEAELLHISPEPLLEFLRQRRRKWEEGVEVNGEQMCPLRILLLPLKFFTLLELGSLQTLVQHVHEIYTLPVEIQFKY